MTFILFICISSSHRNMVIANTFIGWKCSLWNRLYCSQLAHWIQARRTMRSSSKFCWLHLSKHQESSQDTSTQTQWNWSKVRSFMILNEIWSRFNVPDFDFWFCNSRVLFNACSRRGSTAIEFRRFRGPEHRRNPPRVLNGRWQMFHLLFFYQIITISIYVYHYH